MTEAIEDTTKFSPKAFLQSRRPERFSDSIRKEIGKLDRSVLEHQLSTLNKKSKELAFEDFAKQLCEKTICPNLLEQTGPVAGGDGKVDTQTFPVSEQIKALWYIGINENANNERWAFAVSTQVDWKAKCRTEVRKIKATNRNYKKAFFITNIYAKANQRSELEDSLTKETGIDVRIYDISWILDQIFKNSYEQLAIDTLSIELDWRREIEVGSNDYAKKASLQELNENISNKINPSKILPHQLAWLLETAVLSKELEEPLMETHGLFDRAIASAKRFGTPHHQFSAHYQYAWASHWWFEDMTLFENQLLQCLNLAKDINQSGQWGDTVTLLGLYITYSRSTTSENILDIESLASETKDVLFDISKRLDRPSNALMSKAYIEILNLYLINNIDEATEIFSSLLSIIKEGNTLIGFSFNELYSLVTELDNIFGELESYELLLDYFTDRAAHRDGETKGALLWLKRGARRLDSNKPYQAIKLIGKSLTGLYKEEVKKDLYVALNLLSEAYKKVDLLWASRANLLLAASIVTDDFWKSGDLIFAQAYIYTRLAKTELRLGRVNYALSWWDLARRVDSQIEAHIITEKEFQNFDAFLSQCFLNCDIERTKSLSRLPDLLNHHQLFVSRSMLLHALGYEDILEEEYEVKINEEYIDYLKIVRDTDLGAHVPTIINCEERYSHLKSTVMGCEINVSFPFRTPLVELAESLLSVIEGFFSTSLVDRIFVFESRLDIEITADDDDKIAISHEFDDSGSILKIDILCYSFTPDLLNIAGQGIIQNWLHDFIIDVFAHLMRTKNLDQTIDSLLGDDRAMERSVSFGSCFIGMKNIMGNDAVKNIKSLLRDDQLKDYPMLRSEAWDVNFQKMKPTKKPLTDFKPGTGPLPESLTDNEELSHSDIRIKDLIKARLWDRTKWSGTGFAVYPDGIIEFMLLFENEQAAIAIFDDLEKNIGIEDRANRLRISIIRHIDKKSPSHYRICISENYLVGTNERVQLVARVNTMEPENSENLDRFLTAYEKSKSYILSYGIVKDQKLLPISFKNKKTIRKFNLHLIEAWEVGPNSMESMAIHKNDDPIIPDGKKNPPIYETMKRRFKS